MTSNPFGWPDWKPGDPPPAGAFRSKDDQTQLARALHADRRLRQPRLWAALSADLVAVSSFRGDRRHYLNDLDRLVCMIRLAWRADAFLAMALCRLRMSLRRHSVPIVPRILHGLSMMTAQVCIGDPVIIGEGVFLPHGQVVIDGAVEIGRGAWIGPWVTIGLLADNFQGPTIGDDAYIGTGAKILGPVTIGANAKIAANAVVLDDVPAGATVAGAPARVVRGGADDGKSEAGGGT